MSLAPQGPASGAAGAPGRGVLAQGFAAIATRRDGLLVTVLAVLIGIALCTGTVLALASALGVDVAALLPRHGPWR
jgi:hypothetical protein